MVQLLIRIVTLVSLSAGMAWADDSQPPAPADPAESERLQQCLHEGAQTSWGAFARYEGASPMFKYIKIDVLKELFYKDAVPKDGIYLADDLEAKDLLIYQQRALNGWKEADVWIAEGNITNPGRTYLTAFFYDQCKTRTAP